MPGKASYHPLSLIVTLIMSICPRARNTLDPDAISLIYPTFYIYYTHLSTNTQRPTVEYKGSAGQTLTHTASLDSDDATAVLATSSSGSTDCEGTRTD
jgi:hypothetical protein